LDRIDSPASAKKSRTQLCPYDIGKGHQSSFDLESTVTFLGKSSRTFKEYNARKRQLKEGGGAFIGNGVTFSIFESRLPEGDMRYVKYSST